MAIRDEQAGQAVHCDHATGSYLDLDDGSDGLDAADEGVAERDDQLADRVVVLAISTASLLLPSSVVYDDLRDATSKSCYAGDLHCPATFLNDHKYEHEAVCPKQESKVPADDSEKSFRHYGHRPSREMKADAFISEESYYVDQVRVNFQLNEEQFEQSVTDEVDLFDQTNT